jgi:hypothetical protein
VLSVFTGLARGVSVAALRLTLAMTMGRLFASCVATLRAMGSLLAMAAFAGMLLTALVGLFLQFGLALQACLGSRATDVALRNHPTRLTAEVGDRAVDFLGKTAQPAKGFEVATRRSARERDQLRRVPRPAKRCTARNRA